MCVFLGMGIPIIKMRRSEDRLIFLMGIPVLVREYLYIEMAPRKDTNRMYMNDLSLSESVSFSLPPLNIYT